MAGSRVDEMYVPAELNIFQLWVGFEEVSHVQQRDLADNRSVQLLDLGCGTFLLAQCRRRSHIRVGLHRWYDIEGRQLETHDRLLSLWRIGHLSHVRNILGQQSPGQCQFQVVLNTLPIPVPDAGRELGYLAVMARDIILVRQMSCLVA